MSDLPEITDAQMQEMLPSANPYSVVILRAGPKYGTAEAESVIWEHGRRNFALRAAGALSVVLPIIDDTDVCGVGIFDRDLQTTTALMEEDPGVMAGVFTFDVHPARGFPGDALPPEPV
ncbi:hypothetical protein [Gordonia rhizosphera]|uniref:YCII-related domain-containing protein n=1 Tax=Gordonia rhizosphera NBRC 16068 TaxID=1108045 RepID=K6UYW9_9ACTN|nr:hypothetical protein [Gordonia rhizosphera]GAB88663.1 hypothetical protein GORHZ_035_00030 [Gordonia rhizosphera NBRC 16068]